MVPYLAWAGKNRDARIVLPPKEKDGESFQGPSAGFLLSVYKKTADQLHTVMTPQTRLNDYEKAQLFIGYLASFPKTEKNVEPSSESNNSDKQEEIEHDEH